MFAILSKTFKDKLTNRKYRAAYVEETVRTSIAYQIRAMREQRDDMSQAKFGQLIDKPQSVVSRIEDPDYGKHTLQTLLDIASALDVALIVKFAKFPKFIDEFRDVTPDGNRVSSFNRDELDFVEQTMPARNDNKVMAIEGKNFAKQMAYLDGDMNAIQRLPH